MARVVCAVDADGVQHDEPCFASDMRELDAGVDMTIPNDRNGGTMKIKLFCWALTSAADFLALQSLRPYFESPSAHMFCGDCDFDTRSPVANRPFSFVRKPAPHSGTAKAPHPPCFTLRTLDQLRSQLQEASKSADPQGCLKKHGLKRVHFAWDPVYIPHTNPCTAPRDALHLFPDGLLRSECAWLLYIFFKLGLSLEAVNAEIRSYIPAGPVTCGSHHSTPS
jgi:hypothetical protein